MTATDTDVEELAKETIAERNLGDSSTPTVLMVSGGSDSVALAYIAANLRKAGLLGPSRIVHVNHKLRGADADADERFVAKLAGSLGFDVATVKVDVGEMARNERGNVEAIARRERYRVAEQVLSELCRENSVPLSEGRIFVAHTADDRIENFYMRSIVGTGPGGFRSMLYLNGQVARPLLDIERETLRDYIRFRAKNGDVVERDENGALWREDATNEHTDRFRAYVRHEIVPRAKERNPHLAKTLTRTMNLIADEDEMLDGLANDALDANVVVLDQPGGGYLLKPNIASQHIVVQRRAVHKLLESMLDPEARVLTASVEAVIAGFENGKPRGGYVTNVQGNLAVSANKQGVRIEPMAAFRTRRKRD